LRRAVQAEVVEMSELSDTVTRSRWLREHGHQVTRELAEEWVAFIRDTRRDAQEKEVSDRIEDLGAVEANERHVLRLLWSYFE
jgi:hypothetical protein